MIQILEGDCRDVLRTLLISEPASASKKGNRRGPPDRPRLKFRNRDRRFSHRHVPRGLHQDAVEHSSGFDECLRHA